MRPTNPPTRPRVRQAIYAASAIGILLVAWGYGFLPKAPPADPPPVPPVHSPVADLQPAQIYFEQTKQLIAAQEAKILGLQQAWAEQTRSSQPDPGPAAEPTSAYPTDPNPESAPSDATPAAVPVWASLYPNPPDSIPENATETSPPPSAIQRWTANPAPEPDRVSPIAPAGWFPAGTHAAAILISAADAPAGITSQADPLPVLLRIRGPGILPNGYRRDLQDCLLIGAMKGEISTERAVIRLERLSCIRPGPTMVDQTVEGTVMGMDGKNGIRGTPIWREAPLVSRAFAAGTLSHLAQGIQGVLSGGLPGGWPTRSAPAGPPPYPIPSDPSRYGALPGVATGSLSQGASSALERLADYQIKRAEQYHPVIQITAGQPVDVLFTKGFVLTGATPPPTVEAWSQSRSSPLVPPADPGIAIEPNNLSADPAVYPDPAAWYLMR